MPATLFLASATFMVVGTPGLTVVDGVGSVDFGMVLVSAAFAFAAAAAAAASAAALFLASATFIVVGGRAAFF